MRKLLLIGIIITAVSCNTASAPDNTTGSDTTGIKHPDGVVNSNVISTDSAAWKIDSNAAKKTTPNNSRTDSETYQAPVLRKRR